MRITVSPDRLSLGSAASKLAANAIREAIATRGEARIIAATGASQFEFLEALVAEKDINWTRVELFHLDEYVGIPEEHPASFVRYLRERLIEKAGLTHYHLIQGQQLAEQVIDALTTAIRKGPIDVAFAGVGENGHLAFNDPPADFATEAAYIVVNLDHACRMQQFNEGWFPRLEEVPHQAISMTIHELLRARKIIVCAPDTRKAEAIRNCFEHGISPNAPASILQQHADTTVLLDMASASLLSPATVQRFTV